MTIKGLIIAPTLQYQVPSRIESRRFKRGAGARRTETCLDANFFRRARTHDRPP